MDTNAIHEEYIGLETQLKHALAQMELTDKIFQIHDAIKSLQKLCPHNNGNYDFSNTEECPYCGKKFRGD